MKKCLDIGANSVIYYLWRGAGKIWGHAGQKESRTFEVSGLVVNKMVVKRVNV